MPGQSERSRTGRSPCALSAHRLSGLSQTLLPFEYLIETWSSLYVEETQALLIIIWQSYLCASHPPVSYA